MKKTPLLTLWLPPFIAFAITASVVATTAFLYHQSEESHQLEKSVQISNAISKNMSREVEYRMQALKLVASSIHLPPSVSEFENLAKILHSEYSGFFAINFVSADGVIRQVYPRQQNAPALGKNILQRADVRQYLLDSQADGLPRSSHRLVTFQKIYGVALWVPIHDTSKNFIGWMNGVLSVDQCLANYMQDKNLVNVTARVRWHHPADTSQLEYNWDNSAEYHTAEYKLLNQTISIDLALGKGPMEEKRNNLYLTTLVLRFSMLILISLLVILLTVSKIRLQNTNEQLSFKNNMLNSLSHDLASPLTSLGLIIDSAAEKGDLTKAVREKINKLLSTIDGMLKSVRLLHSYGAGVKAIPIENVSVLTAVNDAISLVDQIALAKKVTFDISLEINGNLLVKANAHTLVNNVLANALSNAIKFSPAEGRVHISHQFTGSQVCVMITDQGHGISTTDLKKFELLSSIDTRKGTSGEPGTGLGLLQIGGFMKIYGGHIKLENNVPAGTKLTLVFDKA